MGMYDSIKFNCEKCGAEIEAQSKSGGCHLDSYNYTDVPKDVAADANRHAPFKCECGAVYEFDLPEEERVSLKLKRLN